MSIKNDIDAKHAYELLDSGTLTEDETSRITDMLNEYATTGGLDVEATPYKLPERRATSKGGSIPIPYSDAQMSAAKAGVDLETGLPESLRQAISLSANDEQKAEVIRQWHERKGLKTNVRMGPDAPSGGMEYYNPSTKRFTAVDTTKLELPTVGGVMDFAAQGAGGGLGLLAGLANPAPMIFAPLLSAAGTAEGQAVSEATKSAIGNFLGLNPTADPVTQLNEAGSRIGSAAAYDLAGQGVLGTLKGAGMVFRKGFRPLTRANAESISRMEGWNTVLDDYNKRFPDNPINMNALQKAYLTANPNEKELLARIYSKYQAALSLDPGTHAIVTEQADQVASALERAYVEVHARIKPTKVSVNDPDVGNREFKQHLQVKNAQQVSKLEQARAQEERGAQAAVAGEYPPRTPGPTTETDIGRKLAGVVSEKYDAQEAVVRKAYNDLYDYLGVAPEARSLDRMVKAQYTPKNNDPAFMVDTRLALDDQTRRELQNFMDTAYHTSLDSTDLAAKMGAVPDTLLSKQTNSPDALGGPRSFDANRTIKPDVSYLEAAQVISTLQSLRAGTRKVLGKSGTSMPLNADAALQVEDILERNMIRQWKDRGRVDLVDMYESAKQAEKTKVDMFKDDALRGIIARRKAGDPNIDYAAWINVFQKNDSLAARQLKDVISGDPAAMQDVRDMLFTIYQKNYTKNGVPNAKLAAKFQEDYSVGIKSFFGEKEAKRLETITGFASVLNEKRAALKDFQVRWRKGLGRLMEPNAPSITSKLLSRANPLSPSDANSLMRELSTFPELRSKVQYSVAREISRQSTSDGLPRVEVIDHILSSRGDALREVMPYGYVDDLRLISNTFRGTLSEGLSKAPNTQEVQLPKYIVRAAFIRPLSREGNVYAAILASRRAARARIWQNAIGNPLLLKKYIAQIDNEASAIATSGILTALGAEAYSDD